jgi:triosephosphate isomerase (TIM)
MSKPFLIVANLKMNLMSRSEVRQYLQVLTREAEGRNTSSAEVILCPPMLYQNEFDHLPERFTRGAQNMFWEKSGSYTGEISPVMLKNDGIEYVLVGHSERRLYGGEDDEVVRTKTHSALKNLLTPIVCIGETEDERAKGKTANIIDAQLKSIFVGLSKLQAEKIILAYEPRWAIGTDRTPETTEIMQVRVMIRKFLQELFDENTATRIRVLYGGSVKSAYLGAVSWEADMDGVLVGRESLFPYEIVKMISLHEQYAKEIV